MRLQSLILIESRENSSNGSHMDGLIAKEDGDHIGLGLPSALLSA